MLTHQLNDDEWNRLLAFKGYGRIDAPIWFMGMEEGGDGSVGHLRRRATLFDEKEDLGLAHERMGFNTYSKTDTWWLMSYIARFANGEPDWMDTGKTKAYRNDRLGRFGGDTLLTDLLPIPCPERNADWPHSSRYPDKGSYEEDVLPGRIGMLREMMREGRPRVVFCYGKTFWERYRLVFEGAEFRGVDGIGEVAEWNGTKVVLTKFFSFQYYPKRSVPSLCNAAELV